MSLNPKNYKLSPELIDEMRKNDYKMKHQYFKTFYDGTPRKSPQEITTEKLENIYINLSQPLKKMHAQYLSKVSQDCYPEKHLAEDFPNEEQVKLCKKMTHYKIFGQFEESLHNSRTKDNYTFQRCINDAKNNVIIATECIQKYHDDIDKTNERIGTEFKETYAKYYM